MAQSKQQIQALLAEAAASPRHRFGQNFMIDQNIVRLVAAAGELRAEDLVIEVGPGTGTLSEELLASGAQVLAVEIDRDLAGLLRGRLGDNERFGLIEGDALAGKHQLNAELLAVVKQAVAAGKRVKLVANLPYNIASPLVVELLIAGVDLLAFTVQKEVAQRLRGEAGTEEYGTLTVMAQLLAEVEVLRTLPPQVFWPAPRIESALVRMVRRDRLGDRAGEFNRFVTQLFSARRKTVRKALAQMNTPVEAVLSAGGVEGSARPEQITPEQFLAMFAASAAPGK